MVFEEAIKLESFCKVGCDFAWTRINTIVIKDANGKNSFHGQIIAMIHINIYLIMMIKKKLFFYIIRKRKASNYNNWT